MKKTRLDLKFWSQFAKRNWEKKALALQGVQSPLLEIDADQIFSLIVRYSERCRKTRSLEGLKLYLDGERQYSEEIFELLPTRSDRTLQGYHDRMNEMFADYCLVCDELLQLDLQKWALLSDFTQALHHSVGLPNRFSEIGLYLGNYKKTPFGVHVDNCGVFSFPIIGTKRFRLWMPEFVKKHPALAHAQTYGKFKKDSELITASPGDMTYWPSSAWHIAESDGSFTATWSIGVWVDQPYEKVVLETLAPLIGRKLKDKRHAVTTPFATSPSANGEVHTLPQLHRETILTLKRLSGDELHDAFLRLWTIHNSKQGLKTVPKKSNTATLKLSSTIQLQSPLPILWSHLKTESRNVYAYAGATIEEKTSKGFLKLIQTLNSGKSCQIQHFLKGASARQELIYLQTLTHAGAISIVH